MNPTDKRVRRTRQALDQALEELALNYNYHEITVTMLTQAAGINRKTFYLHYDSIDDLIKQFSDHLADQLIELVQRYPFHEIYQHPGLLIDEFIAFFANHSELIRKVLFGDAYSPYAKRVERRVAPAVARSIQASYPLSDQDATIAAHFLIHNTLTLFNYFSLQAPNGNFDRAAFKSYVSRLNLTGLSTFFN